MEQAKRKQNRLKDYDYSAAGAYFVTVCTRDRANHFWKDVGASIARPQDIELSEKGKTVDEAIKKIEANYPNLSVDNYVIMPNHIHLIIQIHDIADGRAMLAPTISTVIQQMKGYATKHIKQSIWQKSYHDHIIRGREDYLKIWQYMDENPAKWKDDCYFFEN